MSPDLVDDERFGLLQAPFVSEHAHRRITRVANGAFAMQPARCGDRAGISGSFCECLATDRPHMRRVELRTCDVKIGASGQERARVCSAVKQPATTTAYLPRPTVCARRWWSTRRCCARQGQSVWDFAPHCLSSRRPAHKCRCPPPSRRMERRCSSSNARPAIPPTCPTRPARGRRCSRSSAGRRARRTASAIPPASLRPTSSGTTPGSMPISPIRRRRSPAPSWPTASPRRKPAPPSSAYLKELN